MTTSTSISKSASSTQIVPFEAEKCQPSSKLQKIIVWKFVCTLYVFTCLSPIRRSVCHSLPLHFTMIRIAKLIRMTLICTWCGNEVKKMLNPSLTLQLAAQKVSLAIWVSATKRTVSLGLIIYYSHALTKIEISFSDLMRCGTFVILSLVTSWP